MKRVKTHSSPTMGSPTDDDSDDVGSDTESSIFSMDPPGIEINDAVHGTICLPSICKEVVDTLEFQRLRSLKQCGVCHLVYPSATHSRFEHSIGVCHWAKKFVKHCGVSVPDDKKLCVLLAGLCHDLGHGPFSHLWEHFLAYCGVKWKHEDMSVRIFRTLVANNGLREVFKKYGLDEEHEDLICQLIKGQAPPGEKDVYLYEIIANGRNGLDVDKFEYIMRDTKQFGMKFDVDILRIIYNIGIVEKDGRKYIGFRNKISGSLLDVFLYRAKLHRTCYQHQACKAVELMLIDALRAANEHFRITWVETCLAEDGSEVRQTKSCKLSECHENTNAFLKATDSLFYELLHSTSSELQKSRDLLEGMLKRDLYTLTLRKRLNSGSAATEMQQLVVDKLNDTLGSTYHCEFRSCFIKFDLGVKDDPLGNVLFFDRRNHAPFTKPVSDIKSPSFIGDVLEFTELLVFCTKGKKSTSTDVLDSIKNEAENIFKDLISGNLL